MIDRSEFLRNYRNLAEREYVQRVAWPEVPEEQLQFLFAEVDGARFTLTCPVIFLLWLN